MKLRLSPKISMRGSRVEAFGLRTARDFLMHGIIRVIIISGILPDGFPYKNSIS